MINLKKTILIGIKVVLEKTISKFAKFHFLTTICMWILNYKFKAMPTDSEVKEKKDNTTDDELWDLKKKLAKDIVDEIQKHTPGLAPILLNKTMYNYLLNEWDFWDVLKDWGRFFLLNTANLGFLKDYRDKINSEETSNGLESLKTQIFNDIEKRFGTNSWVDNSTWNQNNQSQSLQSGQTNTEQPTKTDTAQPAPTTTEKAEVNTSKSYEIDHFNISISPEAKQIWDNLKWKEKPSLESFGCAWKAYKSEKEKWNLKNTKYLTVVDFTRNQLTDNRFFVINLDTNTVEYAEKCWHGDGSGGKERATSFWNVSGSHKSSLWASIIPSTMRANGRGTWRWAFPKWLEWSNNASRWIAIHPVKSLVYSTWRPTSQWCFTLTCGQSGVNEIIKKIWDWLLFAHAKSEKYFAQSKYFQKNSDGSYAA